MSTVTNIVITGGPCAGKSTGMSVIEQELTQKGYKVFVIPETATEVITAGVKVPDYDTLDFQGSIFALQSKKEEIYRNIASIYAEKYHRNCIILHDRGLCDAKAYMTDEEFTKMLALNGKSEVSVRDSYDGVFHLVTAAIGAREFYTRSNNKARLETVDEAVDADKRCLRAWTGHPHLRVIDNSTDFDEKLRRLMSEIYALLGEPIPLEIERKYLVKMPDIDSLMKKFDVTKVNILQTYLLSEDEKVERRIRQRGVDSHYAYFYTEKEGSDLTRIEREEKISKDTYLTYLMDADTSLNQIRKDRYCFVYKNNYIELDVYPFWNDYAIIEVELTHENQSVFLPDDFTIIKEVTDDARFKNRNLAKSHDILTVC